MDDKVFRLVRRVGRYSITANGARYLVLDDCMRTVAETGSAMDAVDTAKLLADLDRRTVTA